MSSFEEYYNSWQKKKPKVYEETEDQTRNTVTKNQILPTIKKTILPKAYSIAKSTILPKLKTNGIDKQRDFLVDSLDKMYNVYNDIKSGKAITSKDLLMSLYNTAEGAKTGAKQSLNYIENANENVFNNYKGLKKNQFLTSHKVNDNDKLNVKSHDNKLLIGTSKLQEEKKRELLNKIPDEKAETNLIKKSIEDSIKKDQETIYKNMENTDTEAGKYISGLTPSIGQMGVGTVASAINPVLGSSYFMTSAGGGYIDDAKQRGMLDKEAFKYGTTMGALEGATEMIGVGKLFKGSKAIGKSAIKQGVRDLGISVADNFIQESLIEPLSELTAGKYANWDNIGQRMLQSGIDGAVVGGIMAGAGGGVGTAQNIINKIQNNQKVTNLEIKTAIEDSKKAGVNVDKIVQQQVQKAIENVREQESIEIQNRNMEQIRQRLQELKSIDTSEMGLLEKSKIKSEIWALEEGYMSVDEWRKANEIKKQEAIREYNQQKEQKELKKENFSSFNLADNNKQQQLDIINKNNPADDDMHTWIRNTNDIKDFEEAFFEDGEYSGLDPDFTEEMANKAKKTGKVTVYSSYPIEQGVFVSPSVMEASQYAGGDANKLYSKEVNINDVAWIDGAEGQYAKVNNLANNGKESYNDIKKNGIKNSIEPYPKDTINSKVKLDKDEIYYNGNDNKGKTIYFRLDNENGFKGKEHKSGVSMWEDRVDDYIYNSDNQNEIQSMYGIKDILELNNSKLEKLKREIAEDNGWITDGASAFRLNEEGLEEFVNYIKDHPIDEYEEINFFTGEENGFGADGEYVIKPNDTIYTNKSKNILEILEDDDLISNEKLSKIADIINNTNLVNNQEMLYNNSNESESDLNVVNRGTQETDFGRDSSESRVLEERKQKQLAEQNYKRWEQSIKPKQDSELTFEEQQVKKYIKETQNKDIVFIKKDNGKGYYAGASLYNANTIYIKTEEAKKFGLKRTALHEAMESNIRFSDVSTQDIMMSTIEDIVNDDLFKKQKEEFWKDQDGDIPIDTAIAKDIICDRLAELNGETLDYENVLSDEIKNRIDMSIEYFEKELDRTSSFNLTKNEIIQEEKSLTRHEVVQNNRETARENIKNISTWKDKKSGIRYQLETMERNMYDIIPDKAEAKKINDTYFEPIHTSEAEKQKFINNYNDRIRQFDLNKYESEAVQFLGEKKYNPDFYKGSQEDISARNEIASKVSKNIENGKINQEKVNNAVEEFRKIYDELFELENKTLKENGYKEKPYRKGYFPHFVDYIPETRIEKTLNKLGFKIDKRPLPTDIAGITEQFVPGRTWNKSTLERKTNKTNYNALKGFDTYIAQASDNIFHTENIQRLRGLENEIRYQYSDKGVQERIDNILNNETLFEEEKQALLDEILKQVDNPMPNLVTELRRYTNALANKKSEADRSIENMIGRPIYSTVNAIENRFGANAVGLNIGSAITNFIPITQAYSQVSTKNMGRAIIDTVKSYANNDGFVDKSAFLTSRLNQSEKLYKTSLEKISDKTSFLFNAIDEVTSNIVVRGKYLENIQNGIPEVEAIKNADQFARNVIADRSKGALPTKFEEKNPITKMFTQFQLEVNNQYRYMFKDLPRDLAEKGLAGIALAFFKMFVGAWVYNEASEKITGRKSAFSPIDLISSSYKTMTNEKQKTADKIIDIGTEIGEQLPFVGGLLGGGRVPVNGAIPDGINLFKSGTGLITGEVDSNKAMNTIGRELSKPLYYLLPPFGGGQIKKSVEGIQTVIQGGSYGIDSKGEKTLQFPVENANVGDYIKASIFGKYALPKAKEYVDSNFKSLNSKDTRLYKDSKINYDILKRYITDRDEKVNNKAKSNEAKTKIIKNLPVSTEQKWEIYKSDIFSTTEKKDGTTEKEEYERLLKQGFSKSTLIQWYDVNKIEGKKDIEGKTIEGSSQGQKALAIMKMNVPDEQKNKMLSLIGTSKNPETVNTLSRLEKSEKAYTDYFALNKSDTFFQTKISRDDMQDIQDLGINQDEFMKFAENIGNIKSEKDKNGKTISGSKKKAVFNYIDSLDLKSGEKAILFAKAGYPDKSYKEFIYNYINGLDLSSSRKKEIWDSLGYK